MVGAVLYAHACVYLFIIILQAAQSQRNPGTQQEHNQRAALRQTLQWSHNGKVFSILSHGSEYQPAKRRGAPQEQVQARPVTIIRDAGVRHPDTQSQAGGQQPQQTLRPGSSSQSPRALPPPLQRLLRRNETRQHQPGERVGTQRSSRVNETQEKDTGSPPRRHDVMVGDDPYDPYKSIDSDNPYYNYYDVYERPRPRSRPGYGTRYHQYGKSGESFLLTFKSLIV